MNPPGLKFRCGPREEEGGGEGDGQQDVAARVASGFASFLPPLDALDFILARLLQQLRLVEIRNERMRWRVGVFKRLHRYPFFECSSGLSAKPRRIKISKRCIG